METLLQIVLSNAIVASVLALIAVSVSRLTRRPALAHALWLLVLIKLFTPPLVSVPVHWPRTSEKRVEQRADPQPAFEKLPEPLPLPEVKNAGDDALPMPDEIVLFVEPIPEVESEEPTVAAPPAPPAANTDWPEALVSLWVLGSLLWLLLALTRIVRFRSLLRYSRVAPDWLEAEVQELASQLGLRRSPTVKLVPGKLSPMLWAMGKPQLLVPAELLPQLNVEQRRTLLLHELAHLYRRDHWVRYLELFSMAFFWWHPLVWWARHELRDAEEQCCDAWVVSTLPDAGRSYATALIECVDFLSDARSPLPVEASGIGQARPLKRRLTMILKRTTPTGLNWFGRLIALSCALVLLPMLPVLGGDEKNVLKARALFIPDEEIDVLVVDNEKSEDIDRAAAEVNELKELLQKQRQEIRETEERLLDAARRLEKLKAGGGAKTETKKQIRIVIIQDGKKQEIELESAGKELTKEQMERLMKLLKGAPVAPDLKNRIRLTLPKELSERELKELLEKLDKGKLKDLDFRVIPKPGGRVIPFPGGGANQRMEMMEKKLMEMMKQIEELKQQLQKSKTSEKEANHLRYLNSILQAQKELEHAKIAEAQQKALLERDRALKAVEQAKQAADAARRAEAEARKRAEEQKKKNEEKRR